MTEIKYGSQVGGRVDYKSFDSQHLASNASKYTFSNIENPNLKSERQKKPDVMIKFYNSISVVIWVA